MSQITIKVQYLRLSAASEIVLGHTCEKQKRFGHKFFTTYSEYAIVGDKATEGKDS
uniref:Uncharacterized protein n=1 Tax=Rhizophora mucronata TaxID=61149 RepID=A0A2P2M2G1_RHIMU